MLTPGLVVTSRLFAAIAWSLWGFVVYATLSPLDARPTVASQTSFEHAAAYAALGLMFCLAYPRHAWSVVTIVIASAALLELVQLLTPDRHARWLDALEKIAGGSIGLLTGRLLLHLHRAFRAGI